MSKEISKIFNALKKESRYIRNIGKILGKGPFSQVREIIMDNGKIFAGKIIEKNNDQNSTEEEEKFHNSLNGLNFINIIRNTSYRLNNKRYDFILMDKAPLKDIAKLNGFFYHYNLLKLIYNPFDEFFGDNLLRFYTKQIINALEILDRNYYVHNDIKPQNILVSFNLTVKLTDFILLRKVKDQQTTIPGGTKGYLSPEFYINRQVDSEVARKQDYFALGAILYFLKYGEQMLKYNNYNDQIMIADEIIDLLEKKRDDIKSGKMSDKEFINFLCSLIEYKPEDRPCFEEIYRNIWLNKNLKQIKNIKSVNHYVEEKMIMELQKSDFLIKIEKEIEQDLNSENENEPKSKENKIIKNSIKKRKNKQSRFIFKKKIN